MILGLSISASLCYELILNNCLNRIKKNMNKKNLTNNFNCPSKIIFTERFSGDTLHF